MQIHREFQEATLRLKNVTPVVALAVLSAWGGIACAESYRPGDYLGLDLSAAVLSPKRLGPETQFAPLAVEARDGIGTSVRAEPADAPGKVAAERVRIAEPKAPHARRAQARGAARTRLVHRRGNPLDAQAMDTRIQTWPCSTGGICDWKR